MADHNGDYSPEAEYKRKQKREKVYRSRLRKKIDEGRASNAEIKAMEAWESGGYTWEEIAQAMTGATTRDPGAPVSAQARPPRATRAPRNKSAGRTRGAATREPEAKAETEEGGSWPAWASWASVAAFVGACIWYGIRSV